MRLKALVLSAAASIFLCAPVFAQSPAAAASESVTATCKDGTAYTGKTMRGACRGHGGVDKKAAGAASDSGSAAAHEKKATKSAEASVSATCKDGTTYTGKSMRGACRGHGGVDKSGGVKKGAAEPAAAKVADRPQATGGGAGKVWVNTETKVYHCQGDRFYGKTKQGEYLSEAQAKAQGFRAARAKACTAG